MARATQEAIEQKLSASGRAIAFPEVEVDGWIADRMAQREIAA